MVDLKSFFSKEKGQDKEYYWSLVVEPGWIQAGAWTIIGGKAEVVAISPASAWETDEELISGADTALSACVQGLPEDASDPSKTVFGVSSSWVEDGQIKKEYLEKLKKVCSDLSLEPTGFVSLPESVAHYTKSQEGSPLSGIVVGVSMENMEITVFRLGNLIGTSHVARSVSPVEDVVEGLTRFAGDEPLPSRFILYDGKESELEEIRQSLLKGQWDEVEKIKFLHTPKVEVFTPETKVMAVALGGASEIADVSSVSKMGEEDEDETPEEGVENVVATDEREVSAEEVGFVVGEDIKDAKPKEEKKQEGPKISPPPQKETPLQEEVKESSLKKNLAFDMVRKLKLSFASFINSGGFSRFLNMRGQNTFLIGGIIFGVLLIGGFIAWWFLPKATVTVYIAPRKLDEKVTIFVDPDAGSVDLEDKVLPGKVVATTEKGERTTSATGTKEVGERATGEVTIYRVGSEITIPEGTVLNGPNDIDFTLNDSVTVASGSATSPGTAKTAVTAEDIGAQYNLDSGATFSVGNYGAEVEAKNESSFSGGSSRTISAVSEEDQEDLLDDLKEELMEKAAASLEGQATEDQYFIEGSTTSEVSDQEFSAKVGDEADNLKLTLTIDVEGMVVDKTALYDLAKEVLKDRIPEGYVLRESQIEMDFSLEDAKDGVYELEASIDANLLPEIKTKEVAKEIVGKYPEVAVDYLDTIPGFTRAEIDIKPHFPGKLGSLPRVAKNIQVEVAAER